MKRSIFAIGARETTAIVVSRACRSGSASTSAARRPTATAWART
jgi:hypothetical protein